ncbi:general secretion pathway protein GspN [Salinicola halophilus]|uniref:general secretion pathway protein GspN n=1 Tax=Salinicola halophilus TaxID=184065 RepID=UPI000DA245AF|nr:general secretion pathway protein GspN [Salinicola halophilus]
MSRRRRERPNARERLGHARLPTFALALTGAALGAALLWLMRAPAAPQWLPPATVSEVSYGRADVSPPTLSEASLSAIWQRPIFSPERQPDPAGEREATQPFPSVALTGIVANGESRWIYLHRPGAPGIRLEPGDTLEGAWTLSELGPRSATFTRQGERHTLGLPMKRLPPPPEHSAITLPSFKTP